MNIQALSQLGQVIWFGSWVFSAIHLWNLPNGKRIYFMNLFASIGLFILAMILIPIIYPTTSGLFDFSFLGTINKMIKVWIVVIVWGVVLLIYSLFKKYKYKSDLKK